MAAEVEFDAEGFARGVATAREAVETTTYVIVSAKERDDWESHRPGVELIYYMALIDYETKVLIQRLIENPENRYVWEKYLALHLHEVLGQASKVIAKAIDEMSRPGTGSHADLGRYRQAQVAFGEALRPIRRDTEFMEALRLVRNAVAAHHVDRKTKTMDPNIYWMLVSATQTKRGGTPLASQFLDYSMRVARAVQEFSFCDC